MSRPPTASPSESPGTLPRHELLGFAVEPGTLEEYLGFLDARVAAREPCTVLYHNLHSLYSYFTDAALRRDYAGTTVLVDGMPVIWLMRLLGIPVSREHRLTYVDFVLPMMRLARDRGWRVYHVGQDADTQARALEIIRREVPGVDIDGHHGFFDRDDGSADSLAVVAAMNGRERGAADVEAGSAAGGDGTAAASGGRAADLVLVGFGAPRQEAWIAAHRTLIDAPAVLACGACMEYVAGVVRTPPRWAGKLGLEWVFRLLDDPGRFAFRYGVEPLLLGAILVRNAVRGGVHAGPEFGAESARESAGKVAGDRPRASGLGHEPDPR